MCREVIGLPAGRQGLCVMNNYLENLKALYRQIYTGLKELRTLRFSSLGKVFSLMGKKEKIALVSLTILAVISFCWSLRNFYINHTIPIPGFGGTYTEGLIGQPTYINPLLGHQEPDLTLIKLVFSGLYKYGPESQLVPDLAESLPVISQDQKQYTIKLKNNVKWHNDRQLTADDVVFTIQTIKDPVYKSPLRNLWLYTTVEKLSDFEVKFTTKDVSGPFIQNLTQPILPKFVWSKVEAQNSLLSKYNLEAVGSGPYTIKEIKKLQSGKIQSINLQSNPNYYGGKPKIDTVVFKFYDNEQDLLNAFHSKEIMGLSYSPYSSSLRLESNPEQNQIFKIPLPQYQVVFFNLQSAILSDLKVRQALSLVTDRQKIITEVFKNEAVLPSSPFLFASQTDPAEIAKGQDLEQAKKILDSAGWTVDPKTSLRRKKTQDLALTMYTNDMEMNSKAAQNLADQYRALGIKISLNVVPTKNLTENNIRSRNFDILLFAQKFNTDPDPFLFWHSSQIKDPGLNLTGFNNPAADKLIAEARTTTDQKVREQKYLEFDKLFSQNIPAIFLDQTIYVYALDKNIKNVNLHKLYDSSQRMYDLPSWYMQEDRKWK